MNITINGSNYYPCMKERSLSITRSNDTKNSLSLILIGNHTSIIEGHEIVVVNDGKTAFGGIIQTIDIYDAGYRTWMTSITATGYEQIMSRRTGSGIIEDKSCGQSIADIIDEHLSSTSEYSEGIQKGLIYEGATIVSKDLSVASFKNIFNQLAEASGYRWWVDDEKKLHFSTHAEMTLAPFIISELLETIEVRNPKLSSSLEDYVNKLFAVGATGEEGTIIGVADDSSEIVRMGSLDGYSGVFGKVIRNSDIVDATQAALTAANLLKNYNKRNLKFTFMTKQSGFDVNQILDVTYPSMGISSELQFAIIQVNITDQGDELIYSIISELYVTDSYPSDTIISGSPSGSLYKMKPTTSWTDEMKKLGSVGASPGSSASLVSVDIDTKNKMVMYDGSNITDIAIASSGTVMGTLNFKLKDMDHGKFDLSFYIAGGTLDDVLTLDVYRGANIFRTFKQSISAGFFEIVTFSFFIPTMTPIDLSITVQGTSLNDDIKASNIVATLETNMLEDWLDYIPDSTKPYDLVDIKSLLDISNMSKTLIQLTGSLSNILNPASVFQIDDNINIEGIFDMSQIFIDITYGYDYDFNVFYR